MTERELIPFPEDIRVKLHDLLISAGFTCVKHHDGEGEYYRKGDLDRSMHVAGYDIRPRPTPGFDDDKHVPFIGMHLYGGALDGRMQISLVVPLEKWESVLTVEKRMIAAYEAFIR